MRPSVAVVVIGDIGRSPRMQYHALSLANQAHYDVDLIGWAGEEPCEEIKESGHIRVHHISDSKPPALLNKVFLFRAIWKMFVQTWVLFRILMTVARPEAILIQNPPAIPIMAISWMVCRLRKSKLVIDWHNYGFTILALRPSARRLGLVHLYKWYERFFGRLGDYHFCVSEAMKADLQSNWGIKAQRVYDRPPSFFKLTPEKDRHLLFKKYSFATPQADGSTAFTTKEGKLRSSRPGLIVSSTSWTADENFDLMLEAIQIVEQRLAADAKLGGSFPQIRVVVTGKGDLLTEFNAKKEKLNLKYFQIFAGLYLPTADYASLFGSADAGVCVHASSSKLDLPMKAVDMFGGETPVLALDYNCLHELVKDGQNGLVFTTSQELAQHILNLFSNFPQETKALEKLRGGIKQTLAHRWEDNWAAAALPIFQTISIPNKQKKTE